MLGTQPLPQSNTWHNGYHPGMGMERAHNYTKDKPEQAMRMTGKVVGVISRLIVLTKLQDPIDTPLVEVQWDGVQSTALLSPWELQESAVQKYR